MYGGVKTASSLVQPGVIEDASVWPDLHKTAVKYLKHVQHRIKKAIRCLQIVAWSRSGTDLAVLVIQAQYPVHQRHSGATFIPHSQRQTAVDAG